MSRKVVVIAIVSACLWATVSSDAHAQRPNRSVSRPTLSPYVNLYRRDIGYSDPHGGNEMNPYLRYFQPNQQRTRRDTTGTATATGTYPAAPSAELLRAVNRNQQQQQVVAGVAPTGSNSTFMNLGHFYQVRSYRRPSGGR